MYNDVYLIALRSVKIGNSILLNIFSPFSYYYYLFASDLDNFKHFIYWLTFIYK